MASSSAARRDLDWLLDPIRHDPLNLIDDADAAADELAATLPRRPVPPRSHTPFDWLPWRVWALSCAWDGVDFPGLGAYEQHAFRLLAGAFAGDDHDGQFPVPARATASALQDLQLLRLELDLLEERLVRTAHAGGARWGDIAWALGVSRQTVWSRWKPVVDGEVRTWAYGTFGPRNHVHLLRRSDQTEAVCGARKGTPLPAGADHDGVDCAECARVLQVVLDV